MFLKPRWLFISSIALLSSVLLLSGCSPTKFIEKGTKEQEENYEEEKSKDEATDEKTIKESESGTDFENAANDYSMTDDQKEALKKSESKDSFEAAKHNNLDERVVVKKNVPIVKDVFTDAEEASQFYSYALFMYYSLNWDGTTFYNTIKQYLHNDFIDMLPSKDEDRVRMYESLQRIFTEQLDSKIEEYEMTKLYDGDSEDEKVFFRKYILTNREEVFYKTTIKRVGNEAWQLTNDEPTAGYHTGQAEFEPAFIETKGRE